MSNPGLRDAIKTASPPWLQTGIGEKFLYMLGLSMDALLEKMNQASKAHMPGQGTTTALPYIGADRLIPQGILEPNASYTVRLQQAFDSWAHAGSNRGVLSQILGYLTPLTPMVRAVADFRLVGGTNKSKWDTYLAGTSIATQPPPQTALVGNWNWDNASMPWRFWIILFSVAPNAFSSTEGTWGDGDVWGNATKSWGLSVPASEIASIRSILRTFKSEQWCQWLIVSFDATLFDPGAASDDVHNPAGTWKYWGKNVGGVWVASRPANARYCDGAA